MKSNVTYRIGLIGSGSWATALAKILTDNNFRINWWIRSPSDLEYFQQNHHNPRYLSSIRFDLRRITFSSGLQDMIRNSDWIVVAVPSAFLQELLEPLSAELFRDKYIVSGVKGMLPESNLLLNDFLLQRFSLPLEQYFCITGPCHAEEVATEKLSFITISGKDLGATRQIARRFTTRYLKTIVNGDIWGAQYAAVLKNIYAIGAGIVHGLGHGDNFLAVYIANCAREMTGFNQLVCHMEGHEYQEGNSFSSAFLGDLLVTCYSQYSRNRTFGTMIGKGYSVKSARLELSMVAEGYFASRCLVELNRRVKASIPIVNTLNQILWHQLPPSEGIGRMEDSFI